MITCIIPVYNEEKRIAAVLACLVPLVPSVLKEIIVIDDFSFDRTKEIVRTFPTVVLLEHTKNQGKSRAIADGIRRATEGHVLMIDGDLIGLTAINIRDLVEPIQKGQAEMSISYRGNTPKIWIRIFRIETFSGERCFPKNILMPHLDSIAALPSYGLEAFINERIVKERLRIASVAMNNVSIDYKWHKHGLIVGVWKELLMWKDILSVVGPLRLAQHVFAMRRLVVYPHRSHSTQVVR